MLFNETRVFIKWRYIFVWRRWCVYVQIKMVQLIPPVVFAMFLKWTNWENVTIHRPKLKTSLARNPSPNSTVPISNPSAISSSTGNHFQKLPTKNLNPKSAIGSFCLTYAPAPAPPTLIVEFWGVLQSEPYLFHFKWGLCFKITFPVLLIGYVLWVDLMWFCSNWWMLAQSSFS